MSNFSNILDISQCNRTDVYEFDFGFDPNGLVRFMNWEGGIAFNASFWGFLIVLLVFSLWLSGKFEKTRQNHSNALPNKTGWWRWFSFNFDEQRVGSSGCIYLKYLYKLILSSIPQMVLAIF